MKKLFSFLTLLMLFMGSGTALAGFIYNWDTSVGTWDFTDLTTKDLTDNSYSSFSNTGYERNYEEETNFFWGEGHMKVKGRIRGYNNCTGIELRSGASVAINCYAGYVVTITGHVSSYGSLDYTWENVVSVPESPHFNVTSTEQTVVFSGSETGWVKISNNYNDNVARDLVITKIVMEPKPTMMFSKNGSKISSDVMNFITLDYNEPTLVKAQIPDGATMEFSSSNPKVAKLYHKNNNDANDFANWDVMCISKGYTTIIARAVLNGAVVAETSYTLLVDADDYAYELQNSNKYHITGVGAITNRIVDDVPYIQMQYGDAYRSTNTGMVRDQDGNLVATVLDQNGWRHAWISGGWETDRNGVQVPVNQPYEGTFYKFKPQIDGNLTIWMRLASGKAVLVDSTALTTPVQTFSSQGSGITQYTTFSVTGGHTYYLYGVTQNSPNAIKQAVNDWNSWAVAELNAFEFTPNGSLVYAYKGLVYKDGKLYDSEGVKRFDELNQPLGGGAYTVDYALEFYPNPQEGPSASIDTDGTLTIDPTKGGAIAVKAIVKLNGTEVNRDYYIVTVPYTTHDWWFTESVDPQELTTRSTQDFTTWGLTYKVQRPEYKTVTIDGETSNVRLYSEIKAPVLCCAKAISGNNAGYAVQTAGLVFNTPSKRFGVNTNLDWSAIKVYENGNVKLDNNGYEVYKFDDPLELDAAIKPFVYDKKYTDTFGYPTTYVTMATYSSMTIPNLQAGQHIRIYWERHAPGKGDEYKATGVADLKGTPITGSFWIGNGTGYTEFIAMGGDATFTLQQEVPSNTNSIAWTNILRITVGAPGEFLETGFNARIGNIAYNPRPAIPLCVKNPQGEIEYIDYHGQNLSVDYPGYTWVGDNGHWGPMAQYNMPYETFVQDGNGTTQLALGSRGSTSSLSVSYDIVKDLGTTKGTGSATISGNNITFQGNGIVGIVAYASSNNYVLDIDTLTMAYGNVNIQQYPHTWDFSKIGINTTTPTMLSDAYDNATGIDWYKKNTWGDPNTADEDDYKMWEPATDVEGEYILNGYHKAIKATVFAQGSQLTAGFVPIEETKGLGIYLRKGKSGNYFIYSIADDNESSFSGNDMLRYGTINGQGYLKFPTAPSNRSYIIRVPAVSKTNGERVYICADGTPTVYQEQYANGGNGSNSTITELDANTDGNNSYFVPENDGDVYIDVTGMKVFKIGVTSTFKNLNTYANKSYATESREHNERYDLSGYFTGDNVSAFQVVGYSEADARMMTGDNENGDGEGDVVLGGKLALEPIDVADANTGVLLVGAGKAANGHFKGVPLFVKDVNTDLSDTQKNVLKPSYIDGASNADNISKPYILTRTYTPADPNNPDQPAQGASKKTGPLAFYKMWSGELAEHLAYLDMPETTSRFMRYSLTAGESFSAGEQVEVKNSKKQVVATVTYGASGNDFAAASANTNVSGFTAYTAGNNTDGENADGTFYTIVPQKDGTIEVAVVLNAGKPFYITEDGTPLAAYDGITVTEKYYGTFSFAVTANKTYKVYCTGSKLGFYGFNYYYETSASSTNYDMFWFIDEEEGELNGIEQVTMEDIANTIESENAVYYNINGQKLNSKPTQRGIYICNGKKFYVK